MDSKEVREARGWRGLIRHWRERAARGWSVYDWWSADTHITAVIGELALRYRDKGSGYPGGMTEEEWADILTRIGEPLIAYSRNKFQLVGDEEITLHEKAKEALLLFTEHYDHFWD